MEGFDDLLTPSRTAFEENPFEDPFAKPRPSSPDPWATIRPAVPEELEPSEPADKLEPSEPADDFPTPADFQQPSVTSSPSQRNESISSVSGLSALSSPKPNSDQIVVSPLEHSSPPSDRPFPNLALGGESVGGWADPQSSWVNEHSVASGSGPSEADDTVVEQPAKDSQEPSSHVSVSFLDNSPTLFNVQQGLPEPKLTSQLDSKTAPLFTITVDDPQKVGDPIRGFTMYTVHTRVGRKF